MCAEAAPSMFCVSYRKYISMASSVHRRTHTQNTDDDDDPSTRSAALSPELSPEHSAFFMHAKFMRSTRASTPNASCCFGGGTAASVVAAFAVRYL